jgi:methionyl-tRNA formyltransferase
MNVMLFTQDEPIYMPRYLAPVVDAHADRITGVVLAPLDRSFGRKVRDRYAMFGPRAFVRFSLMYGVNKLLAAAPGAVSDRLTDRAHSVRTLAREHDIPVREVDDINDESFLASVRNADPDLILSVACGQRMEEDLLAVPSEGCVNVHGSLLPKYRGLATAFWVLYHGETESGVTAHYMTPEFDAGDILVQRRYDIEPDDTMHDVYLKLAEMGAEVAVDVVDQVAAGEVDPKPNPVEEGEYYSRPTSEHRQQFLDRGNRFI